MARAATDPLRERLAQANSTLAGAYTRLAKIRDARDRWWLDHSAAAHRVEDLEAELRQARQASTRTLASAYAGNVTVADDDVDTAELEQRLQTARADLDKFERLRRGLEQEEADAERSVASSDLDRHAARRAFLRQSPEIAAVLAEYRAVTIRRSELANLLTHLDSLGALGDEHRHWYADIPLERGAPLAAWESALQALESDPLSPLPDVSSPRPAN